MSIFKQMLSLVVEEVPDASKPIANTPAPQVSTQNVAPIATTTPSTSVANVMPAATNSGAISPEFIAFFEKLFNEANLPGPDYYEFTKVKENLEGVGLTEEQKFKAAWKMVVAQGVTNPEVLTASAQKYIAILNENRQQFLQTVETKITSEVGGLKGKVDSLMQSNSAIEKQIAELKAQIEKNNAEITTVNSQIIEQTAKTNAKRNSYEATHASVVQVINEDVTKINQYIQK